MKWKGFGRKWCGQILRYYTGIHLERLGKAMKDLSQDRWYLG
jgi:hypothetical protein